MKVIDENTSPKKARRLEEFAETTETEAIADIEAAESITYEAEANAHAVATEAVKKSQSPYIYKKNLRETVYRANEAADAAEGAAETAAAAAVDARCAASRAANASNQATVAADAAKNMAQATAAAANKAQEAIKNMDDAVNTIGNAAKKAQDGIDYAEQALKAETLAAAETEAAEDAI